VEGNEGAPSFKRMFSVKESNAPSAFSGLFKSLINQVPPALTL